MALQNPLAALTFIAAPALLTNATSVLAMSTINRMLRSRELMHEMLTEADNPRLFRGMNVIEQVNRAEQQGLLLLQAMHWVYTALGAFAAATLVTLLGAVAGQLGRDNVLHFLLATGVLLGIAGVVGVIGGCIFLFRATQLAVLNLSAEAAVIRMRQEQRKSA